MSISHHRSALAAAACALCLMQFAMAAPATQLGPDHPLEERVENLLKRMTLEEKASQLVSWPKAVPRLGIPNFVWDNEGKHAFVTSFPASIGLAATWNPEIAHRVADAISDEARAQNNANVRDGKGQRYLCFWAPTVNMVRDPRWGRANESFGEDPFLTSKLSVAFIQGMQGDDTRYLKAAAGVNHFAVYSEERDRHSVDATLANERLLRDYYLPHFEASVTEGHAAAVGATNNGLNGVPLCVNRFLLTDILRYEWGFKGFVFSDAASVEDVWNTRHYAPDGPSASALTIGAGCEMNTGIGNTHARFLPDAVKRGLLDEAAVTEACRRVLTVQFRLGIYDPPEMVPYTRIPETVIDSAEHRQLSLDAARESIVLLKNENSLLPLDLGKLKRILVAGPRADQPELGRKQTGSSSSNISALDGIRRQAAAKGVEVVYEKDPQSSLKAAASADVIVFLTSLMEGEVTDRMHLGLAPRQERQLMDLIATKVPVVVILIGSGSVSMEHWSERVPAMLSAWYPGEEGGNAIADVLFGNTNPSGKLPLTFYRSEEDLSPFEEFDITKGNTYLYCKKPLQWPFGHGLSYTNFAYSNLVITPDAGQPGHLTVRADVTNTGKREGQEVAQLYLHTKQRSTGDQPLQQLRGFDKFHLAPGETHTVEWKLTPRDLAFHDKDMSFVVEPGDIELRIGGSSAAAALSGSFSIAEKIVVCKPAEFRFDRLSASSAEVAANDPLTVSFNVENTGGISGIPQVLVDGKAFPCDATSVGPGEKTRLSLVLRLYEPGLRRISVSGLPDIGVRVAPLPAAFTCTSMKNELTNTIGESFPVSLNVKNIGGKAGSYQVPLLVDGQAVSTNETRLDPGETKTVTVTHRFVSPGFHILAVDGMASRSVQVGNPPASPLCKFSNTEVADIKQSAPGDFFIRATGSLGSSWIPGNNGGDTSWDTYGALYLPQGAKRQCVVTVKILSQELVSNHTKSGIMIRNAISRPGESPGYLIFGINGYYGGLGNIEWDADGDGQLDNHAAIGGGGYPKWLSLEKDGQTFRLRSSSDNGRTWKLQRSIELPSATDVQDVGIFAASDTDERPALVQFQGFAVTEGLFSGTLAAKPTPKPELIKPEQPF